MRRIINLIIDYVAMNHRSLAMVMFVLPMSFLMRIYLSLSNGMFRWVQKGTSHEDKVKRVQGMIRKRLETPEKDRKYLCTARAPWMNLSTRFADYKKNSHTIYVGDMNEIVAMHEDHTITLEPLIDVETVTEFLLQRGRMLATTLEIKEATIGGLAMAVGMTTASHKYGLLQETVVEYEIALGDGQIVKATADGPYSDLFYALPWSHGSVGLLLSLRLRTIPVKPYVKVTYNPLTQGIDAMCTEITKVSLDDNPADFIEATIFSRDHAVIVTGEFTDSDEIDHSKVNHVGYWFKPWFYTHVRSFLTSSAPQIEYVPVKEYLFRHDRGIFWTLRDQLPEHIGNHPLFRLFLGWMCPPKVTFLKAPATPKIRHEMMFERVYQDIVLPLNVLKEAVLKAADLFGIFPILVYPSRIYDHPGQFRRPVHKVANHNYGMFFDLGVYGIPELLQEGKSWNNVKALRSMEEFTRQSGGAPFLYADTFMTMDEFKAMFDLSLYEQVRKKYECDKHFPHLYAKTSGCQSFDWKQYA